MTTHVIAIAFLVLQLLVIQEVVCCHEKDLWAMLDSNQRLPPCQGDTLNQLS